MKIATSILAAVLFTATLGVINTAIGADGILSKDQLIAGHEKFPAMSQSTLDNSQPSRIHPTTLLSRHMGHQ